MPTFFSVSIPLCNFLLMFAVGTGLTVADFRRVATMPRILVLASAAKIIGLPLAALLVVTLLPLDETVAAGVLLIAACPTGSIANLYCYLARANVALSVTLTGISCLAATLTMPLVLTGLNTLTAAPSVFRVPASTLLAALILLLLLPIVLGMLVRCRWPVQVARADRWLRAASIVLLAAVIVQVVWQAPATFVDDLGQTVLASAAMAALAILAGMLWGWLLGLPPGDFWPVVIQQMVQNIALAATIAVTVLQQPRFASFAVAYFLVQVPFAVALILRCQWQLKPPDGPLTTKESLGTDRPVADR